MYKFILATAFAVGLSALGAVQVFAHDTATPHEEAAISIGDLRISDAYARATLPKAPVGGGYLTITNGGGEDDRLVSASSPVAGEVQLHEMKMEGEVMKMSPLADSIVVPAGGSVTLAPGGLHLMFMSLNQPLVEGETFPVTLTFEHAGQVEVTLAVGPADADDDCAHTAGDAEKTGAQ